MIEIDGKKFFKVFDLRKVSKHADPKKLITEQFLANAANNYDPVNVHEAVFWDKHPELKGPEPLTGGYVAAVLANGPEFFVSFSELLPWLVSAYTRKIFKRYSAEFAIIDFEGKDLEYFYAMCPTNAPAVRGLDPLDVSQLDTGDGKTHVFAESEKIKERVVFNFSQEEFKIDFDIPKIKTTDMSQNKDLVAAATGMGISVTEDMTDTQISAAITRKFSETKTSAETSQQSAAQVKASSMLDSAIASFKINSAEKEALLPFAVSDFDKCKAYVDALPVKAEYKDSGIDNSTPAAASPASAPVESKTSFAEVLANPELVENFTEDQLKAMHASDPKWKGNVPGFVDRTR